MLKNLSDCTVYENKLSIVKQIWLYCTTKSLVFLLITLYDWYIGLTVPF